MCVCVYFSIHVPTHLVPVCALAPDVNLCIQQASPSNVVKTACFECVLMSVRACVYRFAHHQARTEHLIVAAPVSPALPSDSCNS